MCVCVCVCVCVFVVLCELWERKEDNLYSLQTLDDSLSPEVVPAVETWFSSATNQGTYVCM